MKNVSFIFLAVLTLCLVSCGGSEEETVKEEPKKSMEEEVLETAVEYGVDNVIDEVEEQVSDSTSDLHQVLDTIGAVIEENSEVIEDALQEGFNKLR